MLILIISLIVLVCIALMAGYIRNQRLQKKIERGENHHLSETEQKQRKGICIDESGKK